MTLEELKAKLAEAIDRQEWELAHDIAEDIAHRCRLRQLEVTDTLEQA